jgi:Sec-independent protein translocase protein TatA
MFGFGSGEFLVIFLALLIIVNPKDWPSFVRKIGKIVGQISEYKKLLQLNLDVLEDSGKLKDDGAFGSKVDKDGNFIKEKVDDENSKIKNAQ